MHLIRPLTLTLALLLILFAGRLTPLAAAEGERGDRPNILFAIADDWGWPHASAYGDAVVKTPTFDALAREGVLFHRAFVSSPSCTPSRNAMLTGQYHWRLGAGANLWTTLPEEHQTFPNLLEDHGYFVGSYRKVQGPGEDRGRGTAGQEYESFERFLAQRPKGQPFCFMSGASDPHRGYDKGSGVESGIDPSKVVLPPYYPDNEAVRSDVCDYYFEVQRFDREIGEQLALLDKIGELDNTIVIMTGDHGWPFPRGKSNLYDLGVRVPLAIRWGKGLKNPGRVVEDYVSFVDFAPTLLELAGVEPLDVMSGKSLAGILGSSDSGRVEPGRDHAIFGKERHVPGQADSIGGTPMRGIRNDEFLYIHNFKPDRWPAGAPKGAFGHAFADIDGGPTKKEVLDTRDDPDRRFMFELCAGKRPADELYVIADDPYQVNNVADNPEYADVLAGLKSQLMKELEAHGDPRVVGGGEYFDTVGYQGGLRGDNGDRFEQMWKQAQAEYQQRMKK